MRAIVKPPAPQLTSQAYDDWAIELGNSVGRFCSFCEKALTYHLALFHKQHGVLLPTAQVNADDWPSVLLICWDCANAAANFNPQTSYFWPDTDDAQEKPYLYTLINNVSETVQNPDGDGVFAQNTGSFVLVSISSDVSVDVHTKAVNTYSLFRLNGRFFNENFQSPGYTLPYSEYVVSTDSRLDMRKDAFTRGVEAGNALARAIPTLELGRGFTTNIVAMMNLAIDGFGFVSTWQAAIAATLNSIDPKLLPQLALALAGQSPGNRKQTVTQMEKYLQTSSEVSREKRNRVTQTLNKLIQVQ